MGASGSSWPAASRFACSYKSRIRGVTLPAAFLARVFFVDVLFIRICLSRGNDVNDLGLMPAAVDEDNKQQKQIVYMGTYMCVQFAQPTAGRYGLYS